MKTVTLSIDGMHCDGCASNVQLLLERQPGIRKASTSFKDKQARILYDPQALTEDQLIRMVERGGFHVTGRTHE